MSWGDDDLSWIYDRTEGYCRYCGKKLAWTNYGIVGAKGAWAVDHSVPRSRGGSDHLNNLYAACIPCNTEKGDMLGSSFLKRKQRQDGGGDDWGWIVGVGALALGVYLASRNDRRPGQGA